MGDCLLNLFAPSISNFIDENNMIDVSCYVELVLNEKDKLSDKVKSHLIEHVYVPPQDFPFPVSKRKFRYEWLKLFPWLCYSKINDGAYCLPCVLFSNKKSNIQNLVLKPFKAWQKGVSYFVRHANSNNGVHKQAMLKAMLHFSKTNPR